MNVVSGRVSINISTSTHIYSICTESLFVDIYHFLFVWLWKIGVHGAYKNLVWYIFYFPFPAPTNEQYFLILATNIIITNKWCGWEKNKLFSRVSAKKRKKEKKKITLEIMTFITCWRLISLASLVMEKGKERENKIHKKLNMVNIN